MSYNVYAYLIDIEKLRQLFGSGDDRVVREIEKRSSAEIERHDQWFKDEIAEGGPGLTQALQEIVAGKITAPDFAFQHGYALRLLCDAIGSLLPSRWFRDNRVVFDLPFAFPLISNGPPVPIPYIEGFPSIGHLSPQEVRAERERQSSPDAVLADNTLEQMRLDYVEWLEEAQQSGKGLVGFCF